MTKLFFTPTGRTGVFRSHLLSPQKAEMHELSVSDFLWRENNRKGAMPQDMFF